MTTNFDGTRVITNDATHHHPPGMCEILNSIMLPSSATYVREPLAPGTDRIVTLLNNAGYSSFEAIAVTWYHGLLLRGRHANDSTGVENGIFAAYGVRLHPPPNPHDAQTSSLQKNLQIASKQLYTVAYAMSHSRRLADSKPNECGKRRH
jgi:hypothetical protein